MIKIAFYCNLIGLYRYALPICKQIEKLSQDNHYLFIYDEENKVFQEKIINESSENYRLMFSHSTRINDIRNIFKTYDIDILIVFAQRIPDSAYVSIAKSMNIKTAMFQHGLYIPFMKREPELFVNNILKTFRYMFYSFAIAKVSNQSKLDYLYNYMKIFLKGEKITNTSIEMSKVNTDYVFVYGEYWKKYHHQEFGYSYDSQYVVGYPELIQVDKIISQPKNDGICYIAQTLVEDGRLSRDVFLNFIYRLSSSIAENKKVYIKLHPRSDLSLYKRLIESNKAELCKDYVPHCTHFIGHYSTLLAVTAMVTSNILLWEFDGHQIPSYFTSISKFITNDSQKLSKFINLIAIHDSINETNIQFNFKDFFYYDGENPWEKTAKTILEKFNNK